MSMLAERKRKQRWSLNPRGKLWTEDNNGLGQKMLEKMGWKHGKGLGANEDGHTESLKVSYKNDSKGVGYKEVEEWTAHDDNFSSLLENLNGNTEKSSNDIKITSLEKKVQNCKARLNYHKFTKAKDLSRYSEKDLANIFGKKSLKQKRDKDENTERIEIEEVKNDMLVNKGSMTDYFKRKLPNFENPKKRIDEKETNSKKTNEVDDMDGNILINKGSITNYFKKLSNFGNTISRSDETESENERVSFAFSNNTSEINKEDKNGVQDGKKKKRKYAETLISNADSTEILKESKKQKKSKFGGNFISYVYEDNLMRNAEENGREECSETTSSSEHKNKKKGRKNLENSTEQIQNSHCENSLNFQINVEGNSDKIEKKKSKSRNKVNVEIVDYVDKMNGGNISEDDANFKLREAHENTAGITTNGDNDEIIVATESKKKKSKRDKIKHAETEIIEENEQTKKTKKNYPPQLQNEIEQIDMKQSNKKQKKSRLNEQNDSHGISNPAFNDFNSSPSNNSALQEEDDYNQIESNETRKKKKDKGGIVDPIFDIVASTSDTIGDGCRINNFGIRENEPTSIETPKKKRKKKEDVCRNGIDNPTFNIVANTSDVIGDGISLNNSEIPEDEENQPTSIETPKKKKKKTKNKDGFDSGIDNPTFNIVANTSDIIGKAPSNPSEIKIKKKKKKFSEKQDTGLDNPALNLSDIISDGDLLLNVVNTPVILKKPTIEKFAFNSSVDRVKSTRRKSVRFSEVLQERIIPNDPSERTNEYISNRNELFDINTMVIEEGIKQEMEKQGITYKNGSKSTDLTDLTDPQEINRKIVESSVKEELNRGLNTQAGFINNGFDIRSVDKANFYDGNYEVKSSPAKGNGIDNKAFSKIQNHIQENVESISNTIDKYQAEVENDINESKDVKANSLSSIDCLVGDVGTKINKSIKVKEGTKLCFKEMKFTNPVPHYLQATNIARPKKSYRHLIRGDITVVFKNTNLHNIEGYALKSNKRVKLK